LFFPLLSALPDAWQSLAGSCSPVPQGGAPAANTYPQGSNLDRGLEKMSSNNSQRIDEAIQEGIAKGWNRPVVLLLNPQLKRSRRVYEEVMAEPMPEAAAGELAAKVVPLMVPVEKACALLRQHCGVGGEPVARQLQEEDIPVTGWAVALQANEMTFAGFDLGVRTVGGRHDYDRVSPRFRTSGEQVNCQGPARLCMRTDDGSCVTIYGRSGSDAAVSGILVGAVASGKFPVEVDGRMVELPATEDLLTDLLLKVFAEGSGPHQVAEALRALRQLPGGQDKRLLRLLRNRPGLSDLYGKVRVELTGEA
jgi:hypothetical protein